MRAAGAAGSQRISVHVDGKPAEKITHVTKKTKTSKTAETAATAKTENAVKNENTVSSKASTTAETAGTARTTQSAHRSRTSTASSSRTARHSRQRSSQNRENRENKVRRDSHALDAVAEQLSTSLPPASHRRVHRARMSLDDIKLPEGPTNISSRDAANGSSDSADSAQTTQQAQTATSAVSTEEKTRSTASRKRTASGKKTTKTPAMSSRSSAQADTAHADSAQQSAQQAEHNERATRIATIAAELFSDRGVESPAPAQSVQNVSENRVTQRRPMVSLLFQAPQLNPAVGETLGDENGENTETGETSEQDHDALPTRRRRRSRSHAHRSDRRSRDRENEQMDAEEERESTPRRRRSRLNASERAAAAEVRSIEEDIAREAVRNEALAEDENDEDLEPISEENRDRSSRATQRIADRAEERSDERNSDETISDDELHTGLRIRRRRRSHAPRRSAVSERTATAAHPIIGTRRQREKAYISKIKDVSGSTRLEAKRRRRRETRRDRTRQSFLLEQEALARQEHVDRQMVVRERGRHTQISVLEDNILVEHYVSDIDEVSTVGNIYVGRVQNVLPGMEAAFVNIGEARNGVLYAGEVNWDAARLDGKPQCIELAYHSGDPIMVQVTKDPIGHKGARLTAQITLAGRYIVLVPSGAMTGVSRKLPERERTRLRQIVTKLTPKSMGVIIRTAADGASEEAVQKDFETLLTRWKNVQDRYNEFKDTHRPHILHREPDVAIRVVRDIFNDDFRRLVVEGDSVYRRISDYLEEMSPDQLSKLEKWDPEEHHGADVFDEWNIDSQLRKGMERKVYLPSGGSLVIDRTEAMTTIDVNTGRFVGKGKSLEEIVTRVNLEAAEEIVRQLRLRDIGGMIMIDFVDMVMAENRDLVLRRLIECLSRDRTKHQVAEVTSLGLVQMTRKRVGQGLVEAFSQECPTCHGRGFIIHDEPTIELNAADPYEAKGGDPFEKSSDARREVHRTEQYDTAVPKGSSAEVRRKLAQIAAAATREEETNAANAAKSASQSTKSAKTANSAKAANATKSTKKTSRAKKSAQVTDESTTEMTDASDASNSSTSSNLSGEASKEHEIAE